MSVVAFDEVIQALRRKHKVVFERRPQRWMFGTLNYGDVPGLVNAADGDPWDVFAPGYSYSLPVSKNYSCKSVIGALVLENGNHKIAVRLYADGFDEQRANDEIRIYCERYQKKTRKRGVWINL